MFSLNFVAVGERYVRSLQSRRLDFAVKAHPDVYYDKLV